MSPAYVTTVNRLQSCLQEAAELALDASSQTNSLIAARMFRFLSDTIKTFRERAQSAAKYEASHEAAKQRLVAQ